MNEKSEPRRFSVRAIVTAEIAAEFRGEAMQKLCDRLPAGDGTNFTVHTTVEAVQAWPRRPLAGWRPRDVLADSSRAAVEASGMNRSDLDELRTHYDSEDSRVNASFDPDELVRWAESYGHPEEWAKRAQAAHMRAERAEAALTEARAAFERKEKKAKS